MHFEAESFAGHGGFYMSQSNDTPGSRGGPYTDNSSPGRTTAKSGTNTNNALRPVTIRQLLQSQQVGDGAMIIDGHEVGQVSIVGRVLSVGGNEGADEARVVPPSYAEAAANTFGALSSVSLRHNVSSSVAKMYTIVVTDGSGSIVCKKWMDAGEAPKDDWLPGHYVRVLGSVKFWQDRPQITGTIRSIVDTNEITFHFLECVQVHLRLTRSQLPASIRTPSSGATIPAIGNTNVAGKNLSSNSLEDAIRSVASACNKRIGVTWEDVYRAIMPNGRWGAEEVQQACQRLLMEGYLMTTTDEHHFVC